MNLEDTPLSVKLLSVLIFLFSLVILFFSIGILMGSDIESILIPAGSFVMAAASFLSGIWILKMERKGWYLGMLVYTLGLLTSLILLPTLSTTINFVIMVYFLVVLWYLFVKRQDFGIEFWDSSD